MTTLTALGGVMSTDGTKITTSRPLDSDLRRSTVQLTNVFSNSANASTTSVPLPAWDATSPQKSQVFDGRIVPVATGFQVNFGPLPPGQTTHISRSFRLYAHLAEQASSGLRTSLALRFALNGQMFGPESSSYIRRASGANDAFNTLSTICTLNQDTLVEVYCKRAGSAGTVKLPEGRSVFLIEEMR